MKKRILILGFVAVLFTCLIAWVLRTSREGVTILDQRFQVVGVRTGSGSPLKVYAGNQLIGRTRERLARLKFPVQPLQTLSWAGGGTNYWLLIVVYKGDFSKQQLQSIEADFVSEKEQVPPLPSRPQLARAVPTRKQSVTSEFGVS